MTIKVSALEKIVLFGDSLMAGYGLPNEHHLSMVLQENLRADGYNVEVINKNGYWRTLPVYQSTSIKK